MEKVETKRKGTPKSEAIIGTGVGKLSSALQLLTAASAQFGTLERTVTEQSLVIADNENKIAELKTKYTEAKRAMEVQLDLDKKASIQAIVYNYLSETNQLITTIDKWNELQDTLTTLKNDQAKEIAKAVGAATSSLTSKHEADNRVNEATYKAKEAENAASIQSLTAQLKSANNEIESWKKQLNDEREASIKRAQAQQPTPITVTGNGR